MYAHIATGLKDLDTLEDAYKVMDQLNHFTQVNSITGKKQNKTANEKTRSKQASKDIKRLEIEEHFAAKSLPPDI